MKLAQLLNVDNIRAKTAELRAARNPEPVNDTSDPQMREIERVLSSSNFGCQQNSVAKLVAAIMGKPIPEPVGGKREMVPFVVGALITVDGGTYLVISLDDDLDARYVDSSGRGNAHDGDTYIASGDIWDAASETEVDAFLLAAGLIDG